MSNLYFDWNSEPIDPVWATIGNFDSVHLGHQALISQVIGKANADQVNSLAITLWPHPRVFSTKESKGFYLISRQERYNLLEKAGLDGILTLEFNKNLANLSPEKFLQKLNWFAPLRGLIVGKGFVLGKNRQGTEDVLREICSRMGIAVEYVEPLKLDGKVVSSQRIRKALDEGDVNLAARLLGRTYELSGVVAHGNKIGSKLGFPTANIYFDPDRKLPRYGVYATIVELDGSEYMGVTNVGIRPTFDDGLLPSVETLLLDFDGNIYGKVIHVKFIQYMRDEEKYEHISDLIDQIEKDKDDARRILKNGI